VDAKYAENKIKLCLSVIIIDYMVVKKKKKNRNAAFELRVVKTLLRPS
jgi:hypothetical protein